jgi:hypothetical protein
LIKNSILKYSLENFAFVILEYTQSDNLVYMREREQYWINLLNPELNIILKVDPYATSSPFRQGRKHTEKTKEILRKIAFNRTRDHNPGFSVIVKNTESEEIHKYKSVREAARALKADTQSIRVRILNDNEFHLRIRRINVSSYKNKLFRKKYLIYLE